MDLEELTWLKMGEDLKFHFNWITPDLAIGSFEAATPPHCWNNFDAILNVSNQEHQGIRKNSHDYLWVPFIDGDSHAFARALDTIINFLKEHEGKRRLVHCSAGVSRSVASVLAYLSEVEQITTTKELEDIFLFIKRSRLQANPSRAFIEVIAQRFSIEPPKIGWHIHH